MLKSVQESSLKFKLKRIIWHYNLPSLTLRISALAGKFLLITFLSKWFSLADLGVYGLFVTTIIFVNYIQGIEFHAYATREILATVPTQQPALVFNQTIAHFAIYALVLPSCWFIFSGGFLPVYLLGYFLSVAVMTHLGQEIHRLLIVLARPTAAYTISFLTHGLWAYLVIIVMWIWPATRQLEIVFGMWALLAMMGLFIGAVLLYQMGLLNWVGLKVNLAWIGRGISVSHKFFVGAISYRLIDLSDRYFVQYFHGEAAVGIYTLFGSVANIAQDMVFTGVVAITFPLLVASQQRNDLSGYQSSYQQLKRDVWIASIAVGALLIIAMYGLLYWLNRPELFENLPVFFVLMGNSFILNISLVSHYVLYAHTQDKKIMWSVVMGVILNLILNFTLIPTYNIWGAAVATAISFAVVGLLKWWLSRPYQPIA